MPVLYPDSGIGIIGGGQLGRMIVLECRRLGYSTSVLDPDPECPAAQVAERAFHPDNAHRFADNCNIATYEFEHVGIDTVRYVESKVKVSPATSVLSIKQSRVTEKTYLAARGFPVPRFWILNDGSDIKTLIEKTAIVAKLSRGGYDGKGLYVIKDLKDFERCRDALNTEMVAEEFVPFKKEISVICVRNEKGDTVTFPIADNIHDKGILLYSSAPAIISKKAEKRACEIASELAKALELTGILCVEMFLLENDDLLINEFAPRPHNSGHYTIDACDISQFEMLVRAICGLPMTKPVLLCHAAMLNILGKGAKNLDFPKLLSLPGIKVHLYGKKEVRERRKMGHINILGKTSEEVKEKLGCIQSLVTQGYGDL
ncbi:MAG: 5-(carboxyamino)imidazole ribonucleotide synthase [Candidatus Loosdrechtia sp.]|uniref:5-(carboxyamino)imidazole ribonucleotide synthase n=1 Tax=Candidatus Loosdrechtia sp. TaxID=3101272 RepID=UPI003A630E85|nr:MAG: 5-(carboxyamino)imidazole ribonucleotide synthase [Candidatus Jettenia sp. AMX2]